MLVNQNNNSMITELSILENISMNVDKKYNVQLEKNVVECGCGKLLQKDIRKLSGGEKRLVSLLRVIFSKEKIILIDEPTNMVSWRAQ